MRFFYFLKFFQIILTLVPLFVVFFTDELCGSFITNKELVEGIFKNKECELLKTQIERTSTAPSIGLGAIMDTEKNMEKTVGDSKSRMGRFFKEVLRSWDSLWGYDVVAKEKLAKNESISDPILVNNKQGDSLSTILLPTEDHTTKEVDTTIFKRFDAFDRDNIMVTVTVAKEDIQSKKNGVFGFKQCAKIRMEDYFGQNRELDSVGNVLQQFSAPIIFFMCYLIIIFFHCITREPLPYECCALSFTAMSLVGWGLFLYRMLIIEQNWDVSWAKFNIHPELMYLVIVGEFIAPPMIILIAVELLFGSLLMRQVCVVDYRRVDVNGEDLSRCSVRNFNDY